MSISITKTTFALLAAPSLLLAHPDHGTEPGKAPDSAVITGNGAWTYEVVPGWGTLPDNEKIGPTHGGVVVGPDGTVYASTDAKHSILVYKPDGTWIKNIAPECSGFHAMAITEEDGEHYIYGAQLSGYTDETRTERRTPRVCKLDLDGKIVLEIPNEKTGEIEGGWKGLTGVAVAPDGSIFASMGYASQKVHKFDADGKHLLTFGEGGTGDGQFKTCHGLGIDLRFDEPRLLVADRENRRLTHFTLDGEWIGVHAEHLRRPCAVSFHGDHVAVAELQARVTILDKNGAPVSFLGDNPNRKQWANFKVAPEDMQTGIFTAPHGLAFDSEGNLYVEDWNATGRVTKLVLKK